MKAICVLLGLAIACHAETYEELHTKLTPELNAVKKSWTAGYNEFFAHKTQDEIHSLCDARLDKVGGFPEVTAVKRGSLPDTFDVREKWPKCATTMSEVRSQSSHCVASWALITAEVATDRTCIKYDGATDFELSSKDITCFCTSCGQECGGGFPLLAMNWWVTDGIVTGSNFGAQEGCKPYPSTPTPDACVKSCAKGYPKTYAEDKHHASSAYMVSSTVANIQQEIFNNGPVAAAFQIYADFLFYVSGVYHHVSGGFAGGHLVKIIGWGTENGSPYWLVANSWNTTWGEKGFFKIKRGNDECGIESDIIAGMPLD